jgi:UDP-N-acetylglucosamine 1-carboxyvinyltransferase
MNILVRGNNRLEGRVRCEGAKNAALPILAASVLSHDKSVIEGVPDLADVEIMLEMLRYLGAKVSRSKGKVTILPGRPLLSEAPYELVRKMRASFLIMGPLLVRNCTASVPLPGGCAIGSRPVDFHIKGFQALGATVEVENGFIKAVAPYLKGNVIYLDFPSVGATENIMMAACLAAGETIIENAAQEPEVVDLANFLNAMGADVRGAGTSQIRIHGVKELHGAKYTIIPDRIEAATFLIAGAITQGKVMVDNVIPTHLRPILSKLKESGAHLLEGPRSIQIQMLDRPQPVNIKTLPYPGFPTDVQSPYMSLLCHARGTSVISETIFENRFAHVEELRRMGAKIRIEGSNAVIEGVPRLTGALVQATDLRAGAALTLAALSAEGITEIFGTEHIVRGYNRFVEKLQGLGANISWAKSRLVSRRLHTLND